MDFDLRPDVQGHLEQTVITVVREINSSLDDCGVILAENRGDVKGLVDRTAHDLILESYPDVPVLTEEGRARTDSYRGEFAVVADPIDGTSEMVRRGTHSSPTCTSIMAIENGRVVGAAVGHLWRQDVYGIDQSGLYVSRSGERMYFPNGPHDRNEINAVGYTRKGKRARFLIRTGTLMEKEIVQSHDNDGGGTYPLQVAENSQGGFTCHMEFLPKGLWEHIPTFMAMYADNPASTMEGDPLTINLHAEQTAIVCSNQGILDTMTDAFKGLYREQLYKAV